MPIAEGFPLYPWADNWLKAVAVQAESLSPGRLMFNQLDGCLTISVSPLAEFNNSQLFLGKCPLNRVKKFPFPAAQLYLPVGHVAWLAEAILDDSVDLELSHLRGYHSQFVRAELCEAMA